MTSILGISAFYHDAAAALVVDGEIVAAAEEERFSRKKHDFGFPARAIDYCLMEAGLAPGQVDYVGFYDKPVLKFDRLLETYLAFGPRGFHSFVQAMPLWLGQKLHLRRELDRGLRGQFRKRYVFTHHHESHAASAFFPSPFEAAAILTLDGVGEWSTATLGVGRGNRVELSHELRFPHSLGLLYSAFTYFTGFKVNADEYKLMGLAPYGEPRFVDLLREKVADVKPDGSLHLDLSYFDYCQGLRMTSRKMDALFGGPPRAPESPITQREMDIAASIQKLSEEIVLGCARTLHARTGLRKLCLAGGVALNCVANGRVRREGPFEDVWVQPAAGDAGGALGVALFIWHQLLDKPRITAPHDRMRGALLGPQFDDAEIRAFLDQAGARYQRVDDDAMLCERVASALAGGKVVGWFQGRVEFGPRALGSRSILADARQPEMQALVNQKVKFREGFRPFAPAVLQDHVHEWFETRPREDSPYMLLVAPVHPSRRLAPDADGAGARGLDKLKVQRSTIPAVTHVDHSARLQTVDAARHGLYHRLLEAFHRSTGCPVIVNTSFNLSWEPIVCTPRDAYATFMSSNIDVLCMGHQVLDKTAQAAWTTAGPGSDPDEVLDAVVASPCCGAALARRGGRLVCADCETAFAVEGGIARLAWPRAPGAEDADGAAGALGGAAAARSPRERFRSLRALLDASRRDRLARALDDSIPYNTQVLVVAHEPGALANLLGVGCRRVVGASRSLVALGAAEAFRAQHELGRVRFVHTDPAAPAFRPGAFDALVFSPDADTTLAALGPLARRVRPGGHVVLALAGPRPRAALRALAGAGLEIVRAVPPLLPAADDLAPGELFEPRAAASWLDLSLAALRWRAARVPHGAVLGERRFLVVARRPGGATSGAGAAAGDGERAAGGR